MAAMTSGENRQLIMFVTAVCFLFLLKLKWPKDKNIYIQCCPKTFSQNVKHLRHKPNRTFFRIMI